MQHIQHIAFLTMLKRKTTILRCIELAFSPPLSFLRGILNADASMLRKITTDNTSITEVAWVETGSMQGWNLTRVRQ